MNNFNLVSQGIAEYRVFAIVRGIQPEQIEPVVEALVAGGIRLLEVTFDREGPIADTLDCVKIIRRNFADRVVCGVGTVTDERQVNAAARAGAQFVVSPNVHGGVIRLTRQLGMVSIPGAFTPTEVVEAREAGADFVKLFPGGLLGVPYFKAVSEVLKDIPMIVVGGINASNAGEFINCGASGVGVGGYLVNAKEVVQGRFEEITRRAEELVNSINK